MSIDAERLLCCGFALPRFREQEAAYQWKCSAAEISREGIKSLKRMFAFDIKMKNNFGDYR